MSEGQSTIDILIKFGLDKTQAEAALVQMKALNAETGEASKLAGKLEENERALHLALERMGASGKEAGIILRNLFNPTSLGIALGVSGLELFNRYLENTVKILSGMQLPDLSEPIRELSEAATAAEAYSNALDDVVNKYNDIEAAAARALKAMQEVEKFNQEMAKLQGAKPHELTQMEIEAGQRELAAKQSQKEELEMSADIKRRQAGEIKVASAKDDEKNLADAKGQADAARQAQAEAKERLELVERIRGGGLNIKDKLKFVSLYGASTTAEAQALEESNLQNAEAPIQKYTEMLNAQAGREAMRKRKEQLEKQAGEEEGRARVLGQEIPEDRRRFSMNEQLSITKSASELMKEGGQDFSVIQKANSKSVVSGQDMAAAAQALQNLHATITELSQLLPLMRQVGGPTASLQKQIDQLKRELSSVEMRHDRPFQ